MRNHTLFLHPTRWTCGLLAALTMILTPVRAADTTVPIEIQCSPAVVILDSVANGDWMTVHTDLRFSALPKPVVVDLNGLAATSVFSDNRGNLVAKFRLTTLKAMLPTLVMPDTSEATLILTVVDNNGVEYTGSDVVRVMD